MLFSDLERPRPKSGATMRWTILFATAGMMWGNYFVYDIPSCLSTPLQKHLSLTEAQYAYLVAAFYTSYSIPNFILPCLSGFAAHRYGEKRVLGLSLAIGALGSLLFAASIPGGMRPIMILGRALVGIGGEIPGVIAIEVVTRWFREDMLVLALAILMCCCKLGSVTAAIIIPRLISMYDVPTAALIATAISLTIGLCSATYLICMDTPVPKVEGESPSYKQSISRLPHVYWLLAIIASLVYSCLVPFNNSALRFLSSRYYAGDDSAAGLAVGLPNTISGALALPFGILLELPRFKNYQMTILVSVIAILVAHLCFLLLLTGPLVPLSILGISDSAFSIAFWPAVANKILNASHPRPAAFTQVPLFEIRRPSEDANTPGREEALDGDDDDDDGPIVSGKTENEDLVVIGYGIMSSLINMSVGIVPVALAIMETIASYSGIEMVFVALASFSVLASARLVRMDRS